VGRYALRRIVVMIPTLFLLSVFIFSMMRVLPGDVAQLMLIGPSGGAAPTPEELERVRRDFGLNDPLPVQYANWIRDLLVNQGGRSLWSGEFVYTELGRRMPVTLQLGVFALVLGHIIAIPAGIISALKRNTPVDYGVRFIAIIGVAVPNFWLGLLIILLLFHVFSYAIPVGYVSIFEDPSRNFQQFFFPVIVLGASLSATVSRMTRATMLEVMREDYVRTARAKGLAENRVVVRHMLRNSILPVMTLSALQLGTLLSGTVIVEQVFTLPGVGRYLLTSIVQHDYIVVQTVVLLFAALFMVINLITDLAYAVVDPRIRYS
jgi:peptide/nickel transport system permease protein